MIFSVISLKLSALYCLIDIIFKHLKHFFFQDTPSTSRVMEANVNSNVLTDVNVEVTSPNPKIVTENRILIKKESQTLAEMESYDSDSEADCSESYSDKITSDNLEISKKLNARYDSLLFQIYFFHYYLFLNETVKSHGL